jgi:hypothetical protein
MDDGNGLKDWKTEGDQGGECDLQDQAQDIQLAEISYL